MFLVIMSLLTLYGCETTTTTQNQGGSTSSSSSSTSGNTQNQSSGNSSSNNEAKSNLGNYNVVIDSCRLATDYEGKPIVIVKYQFTNNDDDAAAFWLTFDYDAYQNGVGLNECFLVAKSANFSTDNQQKEIKKGVSISVEVAYELNDTATDIEVEVAELFSLSDKKITKTLKIN